eukprot:11189501-Alexandrium_andersonii.AAC.1
MVDYAKGLEEVHLTPERRRQHAARVNDVEYSQVESAIGAIGWLTRQLRADGAFGFSYLAQRKNEFTVKDVLDLNQLVRYLRETSETALRFRSDALADDGSLRT